MESSPRPVEVESANRIRTAFVIHAAHDQPSARG